VLEFLEIITVMVLIDGADASVSGAGVAFANGNLSPISITGMTESISSATSYLHCC
jgi:hypothetical protein